MMIPEQPSYDLKELAAELLAYTVVKLFPNVLLLGGGVLKHGFYYDFIFEQPLYSEMLSLIEVNMRTLIKEDLEIHSLSMMRENAASLFSHHDQPFLAEKAGNSPFNVIDLVQIGDFYGLCSSTLKNSNEIGAAKILEMEEKILETPEGEVKAIRLTGTAHTNPMALKKFIKAYDALIKRKDHRILGPEMDLFSFDPSISPLEPIWHPKGTLLKKILKNWLETQQKNLDYQRIETPLVVPPTSFENKSEIIDFAIENEEFTLSPTPLPQHLYLINKQKNLPCRLFEYSSVYRKIEEAERWGLFHHCSYLTDLMTIRCSKKELYEEIISSLQFIEQTFRIFGFEAHWHLIVSKQGTPKARREKQAIALFNEVLSGFSFYYPCLSESQEEEYLMGPRLELRLTDEIGREWPSAAITLVPQESADELILARTYWGSLDRFVALLIERFEGVLPLWIAPEQIRVLSVGQTSSYAKSVCEDCQKRGFRVGLDLRDEKLGVKIHAAEKERIPFTIIIGEQEVKKQCVTVRSIQQSGRNDMIKLDQFLEEITNLLDPTQQNEIKTAN
jgi:threonyl-tRNA synthetase